jgi:hypothetical protein
MDDNLCILTNGESRSKTYAGTQGCTKGELIEHYRELATVKAIAFHKADSELNQ